MKQEQTKVIEHCNFQGDYRMLQLSAPEVGPLVKPGQFIHLLIPNYERSVLRRPFSIYKADRAGITILYKPVGRGTKAMMGLRPDDTINIIGPLGNGYPEPFEGRCPILVAGGYGNAALYLKAKELKTKGVAFFGGRTAVDILCVDEFKALGWDVRIATEDGSCGTKGLITTETDAWFSEQADLSRVELYCCGPNGLLRVMGQRAEKLGFKAWLSLDKNMACGVGACLTCVIKRKTSEVDWEWARCCVDGPVFESREILWEEE